MVNILIKKLAPWLLGFAIPVLATLVLRRVLTGRLRSVTTWIGVLASTIMLAILCGKIGAEMPQVSNDSAHSRGNDLMKIALALTALGCVFFEYNRWGQRRPISDRWKKFVGVTLGVAGILFYFNSLKFGYEHYYHRWDQYHYYMGAKYFPEIGYDGLYKCTAIAQAEIGDNREVDVEGNGKKRKFPLGTEVKKSDKKIRNLGGDNLLIKVDDLLAHPEICKDRFSPKRWEQYKDDVTFFATQCYVDSYWTQMQQDHGYNPPPVWTIAGYELGNLYNGEGIEVRGHTFPMRQRLFMQGLAMIDVAYLIGVFAAIYWAFGWRVFAVAGIVFGTQASAPFYWTGGALLRQDWLFFFVLSACLARKKYFALSGASMVYAGLLRVFPGLVVIGWLIVVGWQLLRHRRLTRQQMRMLIGGTASAVLLIGLSLAVVGKNSYSQFFHHTIDVHDQTPLTNHMGLRVILGHDVGFDKSSGRMRYTKDGTQTDPFKTWKDMRVQRYKDYKPVAYGLLGATFFAMAMVMRRLKNMWVAQTLAGVWIILLSQLTCYYYSYMLLYAAVTRLRRNLEVYLFAFCAITQLGWRTIGFNDDRYTYLTLISLIVSYVVLLEFAPRELTHAERAKAKAAGARWWELLSAQVLGAIIALVPGTIMMAMGGIRQDWSTVMIGGLSVGGGLGLLAWAYRLRRGPMAGATGPKPGAAARIALASK